MELLFEKAKEDNYKDLPHDTHTTVDGGHGRVETRHYTTVGDVDWFEEKSKWPKLTTSGMVESERNMGDKITQETRYFISSLPNDAKWFAEAARGHWGIENRLHWVRDVTFGEDHCPVCKKDAPQAFATLRNVLLALLRFLGHTNMAEAIDLYSADPELALITLGATTGK